MAELPDLPEAVQPQQYRVPNRTDATLDELAALRAEAVELGIVGGDRLPLVELRAVVDKARADRD